MSFKYEAEKITNGQYTLRAIKGMGCPVTAFLNEELYNLSDEKTWEQAVNTASYPGVSHVFLMPDTHPGYGVPIGGVVVTNGTMIQAGSGYDISCGVLYMKGEGLTAADVEDPAVRRAWINEVELRVALGVGSNRPKKMPSFDESFVKDALITGGDVLGLSKDICERVSLPVNTDYFNLIPRAANKMVEQMGSLGGGNHFIEMQVNPVDNSVWFMVHCGSRGYGWLTAEHFLYAGAEVRGLPKNRRGESWLYPDEQVGKEFWAHHNSAANYAIVNRHIIAQQLSEASEEIFGKSAKTYYEISHNLIQEEEIYVPDGSLVKGFVHRKGATRAFPAGHPDLMGTKWEKTGHPCLIPGSMLHGAAILFPEKGVCKTGCSVNHGSGRVLGRNQAKKELKDNQDVIDFEMSDATVSCTDGTVVKGILMNSRHTPLDECSHAYKNLDTVLDVLEKENVAKINQRMYPVANIKG